jgi:hypothetical protein
MIEFMPRSHDDVLAIKVGGSLSAADYETKLIPKLDELLSRDKVISIMVVFDDSFSGWHLDAAWDDAAYALKHRAEFRRMAVVGGPPWVRWCMAASAFLMPGEIRSFPADRLEEAWQWAEAEGR